MMLRSVCYILMASGLFASTAYTTQQDVRQHTLEAEALSGNKSVDVQTQELLAWASMIEKDGVLLTNAVDYATDSRDSERPGIRNVFIDTTPRKRKSVSPPKQVQKKNRPYRTPLASTSNARSSSASGKKKAQSGLRHFAKKLFKSGSRNSRKIGRAAYRKLQFLRGVFKSKTKSQRSRNRNRTRVYNK